MIEEAIELLKEALTPKNLVLFHQKKASKIKEIENVIGITETERAELLAKATKVPVVHWESCFWEALEKPQETPKVVIEKPELNVGTTRKSRFYKRGRRGWRKANKQGKTKAPKRKGTGRVLFDIASRAKVKRPRRTGEVIDLRVEGHKAMKAVAYSEKIRKKRAEIEAKEERRARLAGPLSREESAEILSEWFVSEREINDNNVHESSKSAKHGSTQMTLGKLDAEFELYLQEIGRAM